MNSKRFALGAFVGGVGLGVASLASPSTRDFIDGFLGIPQEPAASSSDSVDLRADFAASGLRAPLQPEEFDELMEGFAFLSKAQYAQAVPIIGKYALLGDDVAQHAIGGMYSFGQGLPLDSREGLRWLALAAAQGNRGAAELSATINATPEWERRVAAASTAGQASVELGQAVASGPEYSEGAVPTYDLGTGARRNSYAPSRSALEDSNTTVVIGSGSTPIGARSSVEQAYGSDPAGRRYSSIPAGAPQIGSASPVILNRAGPGTYSDSSGDVYVQAGPQGVVNTRTGEFSPTN